MQTSGDEGTYNSNQDMRIYFLYLVNISGYSFSVLWLCMSKGSKYWYERHEAGIQTLYENKHEFFDKELNYSLKLDEYKNMWAGGDYKFIPHHGTLTMTPFSHKIFRLKASSFSTSKINIFIGYLFTLAWIIINLFQICIAILLNFDNAIINIIGIIVFILQLWLYTFICYQVLSDNKLKYTDYISLIFTTDKKRNSEDKNQEEWIKDFFSLNNKDSSKNSVITNLKNYRAKNENPYRNKIIDMLIEEYPVSSKAVRLLRSDEILLRIFETTLMQRDELPEPFIGRWKCIKLSEKNNTQSLEINKENVQTMQRSFDLTNDKVSRAYIDTNWSTIRKNTIEKVITLKDLDKEANVIHLIYNDNINPIYVSLFLK